MLLAQKHTGALPRTLSSTKAFICYADDQWANARQQGITLDPPNTCPDDDSSLKYRVPRELASVREGEYRRLRRHLLRNEPAAHESIRDRNRGVAGSARDRPHQPAGLPPQRNGAVVAQPCRFDQGPRPIRGGPGMSPSLLDEPVRTRAGDTSVRVLAPADVMATLSMTERVGAVILDPWYNKGTGGCRTDYHDWLSSVIHAACRISDHVFVWGFPEILAHQVARIPSGFGLTAWLTWYYKNCPSVVRGWRSAQNTCLHLTADDASVYPEHFLNDAQHARWLDGNMRFIPGPTSVLESPLNIGFVGQSEQTGHPAQKPLAVIEPLLLMATREKETVLDPMCGSGTTGEACLRLGRNAILCDCSEDYLAITRARIARHRNSNGR